MRPNAVMLLLALSLTTCKSSLSAQVIDSRAGQIQAARAQKARELEDESLKQARIVAPFKATFLERASSSFEFFRLKTGLESFRLKVGGLVSGSGVGFGGEYLRRQLGMRNLFFRGAAQATFSGYQKYDFQLGLPKFQTQRLFLDLSSVYHNYPGINYYGPGPDSSNRSRTDFRYEDTALEGTFGVRVIPHLLVGTSVGYLLVNIGSGADSRFPSSEKAFTPLQAPGIDRQSNFLRQAIFAQYDYQDNPRGARAGGNYLVKLSRYSDQKLDLHGFRRLDLLAQQYIPFFNKQRVIILRGKSVLTYTDRGQRVPFYLQPTLGGDEDLRGFRAFRFYDDNLIVLNAEYQWETFSGVETELFMDAGKVFSQHSQWNLAHLKRSYGFGFRFSAHHNVFLRLDVGFSREGTRVWIRFNNIFREMPGSLSAMP